MAGELRKELTMVGRAGITLLELAVVVILILVLAGALALASRDVKHVAMRVVCGTNLKGMGMALTVYSNDYEGKYAQLQGRGPWAKELGFDYDMTRPEFEAGGAQERTGRTITASMYLLVREADVSPKSFVCPASSLVAFGGETDNPAKPDITEMWDFGKDPYKRVSYAMHNPYGRYPAHDELGADFAVMADMSPWFVEGDVVRPGKEGDGPRIITAGEEETWGLGNSCNHPELKRILFWHVKVKGTKTGQNVLFGDGHNSFERWPNVGMKKDNIYTFWANGVEPNAQDRQGGVNPTARDEDNDAKSREDSFLAI